jgi:hypothetical protein
MMFVLKNKRKRLPVFPSEQDDPDSTVVISKTQFPKCTRCLPQRPDTCWCLLPGLISMRVIYVNVVVGVEQVYQLVHKQHWQSIKAVTWKLTSQCQNLPSVCARARALWMMRRSTSSSDSYCEVYELRGNEKRSKRHCSRDQCQKTHENKGAEQRGQKICVRVFVFFIPIYYRWWVTLGDHERCKKRRKRDGKRIFMMLR